jgi:hypothetical protein
VGELGATRVGGVTQLRFNCVDEIVRIRMNFFFNPTMSGISSHLQWHAMRNRADHAIRHLSVREFDG